MIGTGRRAEKYKKIMLNNKSKKKCLVQWVEYIVLTSTECLYEHFLI